ASGDGAKTLRFTSDDVTDFAFAASPDFKTRFAKAGDVDVALYYLPEHEPTVEEYISTSVKSIEAYSSWYGAYPHPRLTVVDVPDDAGGAGGMEYPTLVTGGTLGVPGITGAVAVVTSHEIGHQWWPMQTATNEGREPWLDEGLTEYSGVRYMIDEGPKLGFGELGVSAAAIDQGQYAAFPDVPATLPAWQYSDTSYIAVYSKTAMGLWTLERVVGTERFRRAMADYLAAYRFKHPTGADFRASLERSLGGDLGWFFDDFLSGTGVIDYAAAPIPSDGGGSTVWVIRQGAVRAPVEVRVTLASGAQQTRGWDGRAESVSMSFPAGDPVVRVEVDPERKLKAELDVLDNGVSAAPEVGPALTLSGRLVFWLQSFVHSIGLFG
ncbi:MAG TPA: M1 family aminopeptidase, partial [Roseiflexaceae bacterium]